jgi:hypothetical protein
VVVDKPQVVLELELELVDEVVVVDASQAALELP